MATKFEAPVAWSVGCCAEREVSRGQSSEVRPTVSLDKSPDWFTMYVLKYGDFAGSQRGLGGEHQEDVAQRTQGLTILHFSEPSEVLLISSTVLRSVEPLLVLLFVHKFAYIM